MLNPGASRTFLKQNIQYLISLTKREPLKLHIKAGQPIDSLIVPFQMSCPNAMPKYRFTALLT